VFAVVYWGEMVDTPHGERRNLGQFSHDPDDFIWSEFAAWYVQGRKVT
jgi:hypothetical protein